MNYNTFPVLANEQTGLYYSTLQIEGRRTGRYTCKISNETDENINMTSFQVEGMDDDSSRITNYTVWYSQQNFSDH